MSTEIKQVISDPIANGLQEAVSKGKDVAINVKDKGKNIASDLIASVDKTAEKATDKASEYIDSLHDDIIKGATGFQEFVHNSIPKNVDKQITVEKAQSFNYSDDYSIDKPKIAIESLANEPKVTKDNSRLYSLRNNEIPIYLNEAPVKNNYKLAIQNPNIYEANNRDNYKVN